MGVKIVEQWILAALRNRRFFSLGELNTAIRDALEVLNNKPFQKLEGTRVSLFDAVDKPALRALPTIPYEFARWVQARVAPDYHIEVDKNYYSVPYSLVREYVNVRISEKIVEVFLHGKRVASHVRARHKYGHITEPTHMPKSHRAHMEWTPEKFIDWGKTFGPYTAAVTDQILLRKAHREQAYRSCRGLQSLAKKYGKERMESACAHAVSINACTYRSVKSILEAGIDQVTLDVDTDKPTPLHENVRGATYYGSTFATEKPH
ncbi:transposase [Alicyclobacillus sp. SO9]|uniref:transposase n=1 Tax=Alicyclobacillus sp. SO9 TaxID=2665646 RepID=UPI0018E7A3FD|nr:transposase [Alicyclobacillus sp. SO9]QQE78440.1 transposase [Alicyclobacillus sp. SO9]